MRTNFFHMLNSKVHNYFLSYRKNAQFFRHDIDLFFEFLDFFYTISYFTRRRTS